MGIIWYTISFTKFIIVDDDLWMLGLVSITILLFQFTFSSRFKKLSTCSIYNNVGQCRRMIHILLTSWIKWNVILTFENVFLFLNSPTTLHKENRQTWVVLICMIVVLATYVFALKYLATIVKMYGPLYLI